MDPQLVALINQISVQMAKAMATELQRLANVAQGGNRDYVLNLVANEETTLTIAGDFWAIIEAEDDLKIKLDAGQYLNRKQGSRGTAARFKEITLLSTVNQTVILSAGYGRDDESTSEVAVSVGDVTVAGPNTIDSLADQSVTATTTSVVSASAATKLQTIITNPDTNTDNFRIGDSGAGAANGDYLYPGQTKAYDGSQAIYAYNTKGSAQNIVVTELHNV